MLCTFSFGFFPVRELVMQQQKKSGQRQRKRFSFPCWFVFIVRQTFHVLLLMKFKPGVEVPIFSGNSCRVGVP